VRESGGPVALADADVSSRRPEESRPRTLFYVAIAVLAALVPLILIAGIWMQAVLKENERDRRDYLTGRATTLSARLDVYIDQQISVLRALSLLPSLDAPDPARAELAATRVISAIPQWAAITLVDVATGEQILDTLRPLGSPLPPPIAPELVREVVAKRTPIVQPRYRGEAGTYPDDSILIYVPVIRADQVRYVLGAILRIEAIQDLMAASEGGLLKVVIDQRGRILARSGAVDEYIGQEANEQLRANTADRDTGLFVAETLDGQQIFTAFERSPLTGWLAVAATEYRQFDAVSQGSNWSLVGAGALSLAIAVALAIFLFHNFMERRISEERLAASRALGELDARLLATTQEALAEQHKSASEREVLLREIYHRVKNNLQIIQSLLRLGSRDLDPDQQEPFESAIRRVGAMARVHSLLYQSPDLASIDFRDYLRDVVQETAEAFGAETRGIATALDAEPMRVPLDTAVPLAFITVEILTNAFKHAFPAGRSGMINISARPEDGHGVLTITDDGVGLPAGKGRRRTLGLTLVMKLVEQINGSLEAPEAGRSTYRVTFPLAHPAPERLPHAVDPGQS
jgi:two-component sensor histidine kinase